MKENEITLNNLGNDFDWNEDTLNEVSNCVEEEGVEEND